MSFAALRTVFTASSRSHAPRMLQARSLATVITASDTQLASTSTHVPKLSSQNSTPNLWKPTADGPLRPPITVEVDPDHGLWSFFRKTEEGKHASLEPSHKVKDASGRAWDAQELRRKSFKDLHTLWYVCLRERNLLATQAAELRRLAAPPGQTNIGRKLHRVRRTMARIKLVLNERRLAYIGAVDLHNQQNAIEATDAPDILEPSSDGSVLPEGDAKTVVA